MLFTVSLSVSKVTFHSSFSNYATRFGISQGKIQGFGSTFHIKLCLTTSFILIYVILGWPVSKLCFVSPLSGTKHPIRTFHNSFGILFIYEHVRIFFHNSSTQSFVPLFQVRRMYQWMSATMILCGFPLLLLLIPFYIVVIKGNNTHRPTWTCLAH